MAFSNSNADRYDNIMNSRKSVNMGDSGKVIMARITGATYSFYDDVNDLTKDIYNTDYTLAHIVNSEWYQKMLDDAIIAEAAGAEEAGDMFQKLLNVSQLTFSVINNDGTKQQFAINERVNAPLTTVDIAEKDDVAAHKALVIDKPYPVTVFDGKKAAKTSIADRIAAAKAKLVAADSALSGKVTG